MSQRKPPPEGAEEPLPPAEKPAGGEGALLAGAEECPDCGNRVLPRKVEGAVVYHCSQCGCEW